MNATDISDLINWIGVLIIVITAIICYTVIQVKRNRLWELQREQESRNATNRPN